MKPHLHIVSFDIPYPPNYGGVIDVYHKLRLLHLAGVAVHLHCFTHRRPPAPELESICTEVTYYPRRSGLQPNLSLTPYIVASRQSGLLLQNLLKDIHPILFEGLHTCALLGHPLLAGRQRIYRESNIEHHYYFHLFKAERGILERAFFLAESLKLKAYQPHLRHATTMLAVSEEDTRYLKRHFPEHRILHLPSFHRQDAVNIAPGSGSYALYHGNLSVAENLVAAEYLIKRVWNDSMADLVIAGLNPPASLLGWVAGRNNIRLVAHPAEEEMQSLIRNAHINILITFQATGLKLKLLNALFTGRHCLVNRAMVAGTCLSPLCTLAEEPEALRSAVSELLTKPFTGEDIARRSQLLMEYHSNKKNCNLLLEVLNL